jgi:hypothetical protein
MPKAKTKLPTIEYYWSTPTRVVGGTGEIGNPFRYADGTPVVNVRIMAANGLLVAQITQGFRDKHDARRGVETLAACFRAVPDPHLLSDLVALKALKEVGPGPKPKAPKD